VVLRRLPTVTSARWTRHALLLSTILRNPHYLTLSARSRLAVATGGTPTVFWFAWRLPNLVLHALALNNVLHLAAGTVYVLRARGNADSVS